MIFHGDIPQRVKSPAMDNVHYGYDVNIGVLKVRPQRVDSEITR